MKSIGKQNLERSTLADTQSSGRHGVGIPSRMIKHGRPASRPGVKFQLRRLSIV